MGERDLRPQAKVCSGASSTQTALSLSGPIVSWYPRNCTVDVPLPPDIVVTIMSPRPFPGPDLAIILLGDFHSAERRQSQPHIDKPEKMSENNFYIELNEHIYNQTSTLPS